VSKFQNFGLMHNLQQISLSVAFVIFLASLCLALLPKPIPRIPHPAQSFAPRTSHPAPSSEPRTLHSAPELVRQVAKHIGGKYWWVLLAGGLVAVWLDRRVLWRLVLTLLVTQVAIEALKLAVGEVRPDGRFFNSFPSGHTTASFAYATVMSLHFRWGWLWFLFACVVGLSRILTNAHWWNDVTGGAALGYLIAVGLIKWLKWDRGQGTRDKENGRARLLPSR
jgi:PAP2 superfamily.